MAKRRFNDKWLEKQDPNNQLVSLWCSKKNDYTAACSFCKADISVDHMGFGSLKQYANGSKHKQLAGVSNISQEGKPKHQSSLSSFFIKSDPQPVKSETPPEKSVGASESTVKNCAWTLKQMTTKAEIIATLQYTDQNTPFASADNLGPCYQQQFPDSQIAKNVAIGHRKMSYVVGHGLGPYFAKLNVNNLVAGNSFFTLHFDETVTAQKRKQMDLLVRFWSEIHNEVKVKYLTSIMFGHAKAADVVTEIMQALENLSLPFKLMLSLGMDGPNVNKSILAKMNQLKKEKGYPELVQSPRSCLIHVCHNSFRAGLKKYGSDAEELCLNLYNFISKSPARREDLLVIEEALGLDELVLLRHVQSRWLSPVPALQRVISMKAALVKLFVDELPKNDKNITKNDKYWTIQNALESKEVEIQMEFLISIKPIFDEFLTKFQKEEPMIHLLYPNCEKLLKLTIGRPMKNKVYKDKRGEDLKKINVEKVEMQLTSDQFKQMQGHKVVTLMESTDTDDNLNKRALLGMVSFYKAVIKYLQDNLPLDNGLLKALTCLNPREQNSSKSKEYCKTVASAMPCITGDEKVKVGDEWIRYQEIEINDDDIQGCIDHFWHRIFNIPDKCGDFFEVLPKMVKCALALCHSNADVERSLSTNKKIVTKSNTSLKPETLRGLRAIKCAINEYGGVTKVPITLDMVSAAERSHSIYKQHMREEESKKKKKEKEKEEIEERKRKLTEMKDEEEKMREKLDELKEREKKISVDIDNAMDCIKEARNLIKEGRMRDNMVSVESGEKGLDLGIEKETAGREKLKEVSTERQKIEKILLELKQFKKQRISTK